MNHSVSAVAISCLWARPKRISRRRRRRAPHASVAVAFACLAGPAVAQDEKPPATEVRLGSRIPWRVEEPTPSQRQAIRVLFRFAECTVERNPTDALALLQSDSGSPDQAEIVERIVGKVNECLRGAQTMQLRLGPFRGAIANALYNTHYPAFPADRLPASPSAAAAMLSGDPDRLMADFAACVVTADPTAVDALLRTRPASDAEHESLTALSVRFSGCLFRGQALSMNALALRSAIADAAYRLSIGALPRPRAER